MSKCAMFSASWNGNKRGKGEEKDILEIVICNKMQTVRCLNCMQNMKVKLKMYIIKIVRQHCIIIFPKAEHEFGS